MSYYARSECECDGMENLPCAATSSSICSSIRCALPGKLAIPLFDTNKRNKEQTY